MNAPDLTQLAPFDADGNLQVVVESPKGSPLKLEYEREQRVFKLVRGLPLGVAYPFDWGFIPGTLGEDGDPLDAMVLHPASSYPGVLLPCRILGMVKVSQQEGTGRREINNRVIATPAWTTPSSPASLRDLPREWRRDLEQFFFLVVAQTPKRLKISGWASGRETERFIRRNTIGAIAHCAERSG